MAIDTSLFAAPIPVAAYSVGDRIPLAAIRGPAIVRDGYGKAVLKRVVSLADSSAIAGMFKIIVRNSNWEDDMSNPVVDPNTSETALSVSSAAIQNGQDLPLVPNSGWQVIAECISAVTTTVAADVFCMIDIDYPSVLAIQNPKEVEGFPVTIDRTYNITATAIGASNATVWNTYNVDIFKAGSKYLLTEAGFMSGNNPMGFMSISRAAGQAGLERIIPVRAAAGQRGIKYLIDYATALVKGPMDLNLAVFGTAGLVATYAYLDFVRKKI